MTEFPRPYPLDRLGGASAEVEVAATDAECAALAERLAIPALHALSCQWRLRRGEAGRIAAEGTLRARLARECVVTLETFDTETNEKFRVAFVPAGTEAEDDDPKSIDELPYEDGAVDLGEAAAEQLALSLDPYPHKPGAALPDVAEPETPESPFAALARRRDAAR